MSGEQQTESLHNKGTDRLLAAIAAAKAEHRQPPADEPCPKCGSVNTLCPSYPGDFNDCVDCGHDWRPSR